MHVLQKGVLKLPSNLCSLYASSKMSCIEKYRKKQAELSLLFRKAEIENIFLSLVPSNGRKIFFSVVCGKVPVNINLNKISNSDFCS